MNKKAFIINVEGMPLHHIEHIEKLCKEHGIVAWNAPENVHHSKNSFYGIDYDFGGDLVAYHSKFSFLAEDVESFEDIEEIQLHELKGWLNTHYPYPVNGTSVKGEPDWIEWNDIQGECPIPDGNEFEVMLAGGSVVKDNRSEGWRWGILGGETDIVAYRDWTAFRGSVAPSEAPQDIYKLKDECDSLYESLVEAQARYDEAKQALNNALDSFAGKHK